MTRSTDDGAAGKHPDRDDEGVLPGRPRCAQLGELAALFLRLGTTAFGGPAAHIAMMQDEIVRRRAWLSQAEFLDLLGATNLIPGPNSTEMAIHVGLARAGWRGLVVAGLCFIAPAVLITAVLAWAYVELRALPEVGWLLYGVKPVVLAIVVHAIGSLFPKAARTRSLATLGSAAGLAVWLGVNEIAVLLASGLASAAGGRYLGRGLRAVALPLACAPVAWAGAGPAIAATPTLAGLFWVFVKIGSVLFGSGYVLLAFLQADLVERLGWLTQPQLIDAVAIGQVTPGPLFTTATFVGYVVGGFPGAFAATAGIFLPAFVFVALSGPLVPRLRASPVAGSFLDGVNVASLAFMVVVTIELARAALVDGLTIALGVTTIGMLVRGRVGSAWLVVGGAAVGWLAHAAGWGG